MNIKKFVKYNYPALPYFFIHLKIYAVNVNINLLQLYIFFLFFYIEYKNLHEIRTHQVLCWVDID